MRRSYSRPLQLPPVGRRPQVPSRWHVPGLAPNERASRYAPGAEHDQEKARPPHSPSHSWIGVRADGGVLVALLEPLPDCSVEARARDVERICQRMNTLGKASSPNPNAIAPTPTAMKTAATASPWVIGGG